MSAANPFLKGRKPSNFYSALRRRPFLEQRGKVVFSLVSLAYSLQYLAEEARFRLKG